MRLENLQNNWNEFGKIDPLWAIMTDPDKNQNRWEIDEFFASGENEAARVMQYLHSFGFHPAGKTVLDFGCGVGRVTQSFATYFREVYGVDIAASMISLAKKYAKSRQKNISYFVNTHDNLKLFPDTKFDFIYSNIVFQHMPISLTKAYIKEFLRILKPGGLILFQMPAEYVHTPDDNLKQKLKLLLVKIHPQALNQLFAIRGKILERPTMEIHTLPKTAMKDYLQTLGAKIVAITDDDSFGIHMKSYQYVVTID